MDFSMKKLVKDAGAALSRVVQLTEETLGHSEKTELDEHLEDLVESATATRTWTEKMVQDVEAVLTPNPGNRIEDFFYEKIDKKRPNRLNNLECVGQHMIEAGNEFGTGNAYGNALVIVGQCEQKLGQIEKDFIGTAANAYIQPLRKFLDVEMKTVTKELALLENKRLDLDASKSRVRKARNMLGQQSAERELRSAQSEFDRQGEIVKFLLEGVSMSQAGHLRCLQEFVEAQARHYAQCHAVMQDLQHELAGLSGGSYHTTPSPATNTLAENGQDRARVLCSYDARDPSEMSVMQDEVIGICEIPDDEDYFMGIRGNQRGKVPKVYLETFTIIH